jgi:hypothetical protein
MPVTVISRRQKVLIHPSILKTHDYFDFDVSPSTALNFIPEQFLAVSATSTNHDRFNQTAHRKKYEARGNAAAPARQDQILL